MKLNSSNIKFTRNQRLGLIFLLSLIVGLQIVIFSQGHLHKDKVNKTPIPLSLQKQYDSLKTLALKDEKPKIYPFNPNYISDYKAYYLGISPEELKRINAFRQQGKYFNDKETFRKISGISDSLFKILEPYINIPVYKKQYQSFKNKHFTTKNINKATAEDLQNISGIGEVFSKRIIKYRNSIGGFTNKKQLNKVYGLEQDVIDKIWQVFYLSDTDTKAKNIVKKPINSANKDELMEVPGIGDKLANRIIKYRKKIDGFCIKEQLNEVYGLKPELINNIWQYFEIRNPKIINGKIDLNDANIKELARNPYINYGLAKKIISYRTLHGAFRNFDELKNVEGFPKNKIKIISLYLKITK